MIFAEWILVEEHRVGFLVQFLLYILFFFLLFLRHEGFFVNNLLFV